MLIFFDIDATLITTSRAGIAAMEDGGRELYGETFTAARTEFAGRLDPLIIADLLRHNGIPVNDETCQEMRDAYRRHLPEKLRERHCTACPGIPELLRELRARAGVTLGLLTGNFADTGSIKLLACGIDPADFPLQVWGDDSPHVPPMREHLPGVGIERYRDRHGQIESDRVTIIGDTPHDIACARAHGCRSLGVGTGQFSVEKLMAAGADNALPDLSDTAAVLDWLIGPR